tara:strand:+ start:117 stop:308 length:192 start_codon:yes stop_codon:yes gene_type:complete
MRSKGARKLDYDDYESDEVGQPFVPFPELTKEKGPRPYLLLGAVLTLPPSLLLGHDSTRGCQT